jgi:hypothetical protein
MQRTWLHSATAVAALVAVSLGGCSTTRYLGPLNAVTPVSRSYPSNVPRVLSVSGNQAVLGYPGGGTEVVSADGTYVQLETNAGLGALEGFLGGAAVGAAAVAAGSSSCTGGDCTAALIVGPLLMGAIGALYGAVVGPKKTNVLGPHR